MSCGASVLVTPAGSGARVTARSGAGCATTACAASTGATSAGMRTVKTVPTPGVLCSSILPRISRTGSREMVRPSPVPPKRRVVLESACWKASKMPR